MPDGDGTLRCQVTRVGVLLEDDGRRPVVGVVVRREVG